MSINFRTTNRLNVFVNLLSGNILPTTSNESEFTLLYKFYAILTLIIILIYSCTCFLGIFRVSTESALRDSTVNLIIAIETLLNLLNMYRQRDLLKRLIDYYDDLLSKDDNELLKIIILSYIKPIEKILKLYTIIEISTVVLWVSTSFLILFYKNEFLHEDYVLPISFNLIEPISRNVFIVTVIFEIIGAAYLIVKKVSIDIYTLHLILLLTTQYKFLRIQMGMIFRRNGSSLKCQTNRIKEEFYSLLNRHSVVVQATNTLKKILSFNICLVHLDSVLRFCFLSFMLVMKSSFNVEGCLLASHTIAAVLQLYMICFYIQELLEAGSKLTDEAFNGVWYTCELSIKNNFKLIIFANKLKCQLAYCESVDLTLSSFIQIINQAYSVCLLFLQMK